MTPHQMKKAAVAKGKAILDSLYSVDGGPPTTGAQIIRDNSHSVEDMEYAYELISKAYSWGESGEFNTAQIKLVEKK